MIDTASANPYGTSEYGTTGGGMVQFNLLMSSAGAQPDDVDLGRSVQQYYKDCGVWAVSTGFNGATLQELMRGSTDLSSTFAKFANPALSTLYYSSSNESGDAVGCDAAWSSIQSAINSNSEMQSMENEICQKSGFLPTNAAEPAQCDSDLATVGSLFGVPSASSGSFLRSVFLAQSMGAALQSGDFALGQSEIMNRQVMTESIGSANAMNEWIPKVRAFMTATVLGLVPLLALFMMTPLSMKALATVMGLFMWLFFWGIADATASVMMNDQATNAFAQITHYNLGFDAIMNAPEGAVKALAVFGKARGMALGVASLLSASLMAFGGLSLANMGRNLQQDYEGKGERAAGTAMLPEQRGAYMSQLASGIGSEATIARYGMAATAAGGAQGAMRSAASARELSVNPGLAGTGGNASTMDHLGKMDAGSSSGQAGAVTAVAAAAGGSIAGAAKDKSANDTAWGYGESTERAAAGSAAGLSQFDAGRVSGGAQGGRMGAYMEVYRNVNGTDQITGEGMLRMARQFEGAHIAQSRSTPDPEQYIRNAKEFADKQRAIGQFLTAHPGAANEIGWNSEFQNMLQTKGFEQTIGAAGAGAIEQGYFKAGMDQAERGRAANEAGGIPKTSRETARAEVAQGIANARVAQSVAHALGMNPASVRDLEYVGEKRGGSQVSITMDDHNRDAIVKGLQASGQLDEARAKEILDKRTSGRASLVVGPGGELLQGSIDSGTSTTNRSVDASTVGRDHTTIDSEQRIDVRRDTLDRSKTAEGGAALIADRTALGNLVGRAYNGSVRDGQVDQAWMNQLGLEASKTLQQAGYRLDGAAMANWQSEVHAGLDVTASAGFGLPRLSPVKAEVGATARVGASTSEVWSYQSGTSADAANVVGRHVATEARKEAMAQYEKEHGAGSLRSNPSDQVESRLRELTAERIQVGLGELRQAADERMQPRVDANTTVSNAQKLPPPPAGGQR